MSYDPWGGRAPYDNRGAPPYRPPYDDRDRDYGRAGGGGGGRQHWDDRNGPSYDEYDYDHRPPPPPPQHGGFQYDNVPPPRRDDFYGGPGPQGHHNRHQYPSAAHHQPSEPRYGSGGAPDHRGYSNQSQHQQYPSRDRDFPPPRDQRDFRDSDSRPKPPPVKPEPVSASVVLLGLPAHTDDAGLRAFLEDLGASVDSTTVIYDRPTGQSKRYGFAKFSSVEHARAFVEPNFPSVVWRERGRPGPDDGLRIKINYSQKSGGWREDQGAGARLTEDQRKATEGSAPPQSFYMNDGTRDVGSAPTQILLLRGLDPLTSEEGIVAALGAMRGRAGNEIREGKGVKKVMITRDRASRSSWGFCFVQFADVRLATEVLANAFNPNLYPKGFKIGSSVVAFSFCHENSFVPIYAKSEWSFKGEGGQQLAYWDDKAFVTAWTPSATAPAPAPPSSSAAPKKVDDSEADMEAFFSSLDAEVSPSVAPPAAAAPSLVSAPPAPAPLAVPTTAPRSTTSLGPGSGISIQLKPTAASDSEEKLKANPKGRKKESEPLTPSATTPASVTSADKKKADLIVSRKAAKDISKWNVKQQELNPTTSASTTPASTTPKVSTPASATPPAAATVPSTTTAEPAVEFEYGDPIAFICLLCQRQFKAVAELTKHNRLSALHKAHHISVLPPGATHITSTRKTTTDTNLANSTTVAEAKQRKVNSLQKHAAAAAAADSAPKYIDRAAARREAFNQPDHPVPESKKRKAIEDPAPPPPPPVQPNKNGIEETNVGAKMLEKMGWSKGGGLGAGGAGRVDPVQAAQFAQGAGLGSTKGVVVGEFTSPANYKEAVRDKARQRLEESS
ncbi:RNA-binding protein [Pseudohyphozyma bogoriensis]|nr:RNA-binding protein [Pseudohyphozyma bogoriensis]